MSWPTIAQNTLPIETRSLETTSLTALTRVLKRTMFDMWLHALNAHCSACGYPEALHLIQWPSFFSELAAQREKEHLMHSMIFNSDNPIDIHLSNPGDNTEELDPQPKMTTNKPNSRPITLQRSPGSLDIAGSVYNMFLICYHCH